MEYLLAIDIKKFKLCITALVALVLFIYPVNLCQGATVRSKSEQKSFPPPPPPGAKVTVKDTVYGVLRSHRTLRGMQENREVVQHELRRAQAGFGPRLDVNGRGGGSLLSDSTTRSQGLDKQMYGLGEVSARATQPIWDGFATRSRVRNAQATVDSAIYRVLDTATALSLDGIIAHATLLLRRTVLSLSEINVEKHKEILVQTEDRASMGVDTEADVTQAQARLARALSYLADAQAGLLIAEDTYVRLTGMVAPKNLEPIPMPSRLFKRPGAVFELAEKHNPQLASYLQEVRVAQANRELSEAAFYPVLNAEAGPTYSNRGGSTDRWVYSFDVVAALSWNVFNSGADLAESKAASARVRQARQTMYSYRDDLRLEINTTWANYLSAQEQYKNYTQAVEYARLTRDAYIEQFQLGMRSLLNVLDVETELYNSQTQAETSHSNIIVNAYKLCALSGELFPIMSIDTKPLGENPPVDAPLPQEAFEKGWFH